MAALSDRLRGIENALTYFNQEGLPQLDAQISALRDRLHVQAQEVAELRREVDHLHATLPETIRRELKKEREALLKEVHAGLWERLKEAVCTMFRLPSQSETPPNAVVHPSTHVADVALDSV